MSAKNDSVTRNDDDDNLEPLNFSGHGFTIPPSPPINLRIVKHIDYPGDSGRLEYLVYGKWLPVPIIFQD